MIQSPFSHRDPCSRAIVASLCLVAGVATWSRGASFALASAQVSIGVDGVPVVQDFNGLVASGSSNVLPLGWRLLEGGANGNDTYAAGNGGSNSGNVFSYGVGTTSERALGTLRSGNLIPTIGAMFVNDTGTTLTSLEVVYWGEQWRLGTANRQDRLDFQFSLDAASLDSGIWTDVDALDFATPVTNEGVGGKAGDTAPYRMQRQATLAVSIAPGGSFWIRWNDFDASSADDGLAVDDFSLTAFSLDSAPYVTSTVPSAGALDVSAGSPFSVSFNEPVSVTGNWADLVCEVSGSHAFDSSGGPQVYTLATVGALAPGEACELTVYSTNVSDLDAPIDGMLEDYVAEFATLGGTGCGAPATSIHTIQGIGNVSPSVGNLATIEGVVVADFQGSNGLNGFFVQEELGDVDADPQTSEGIFVFDGAGSVAVEVGDVVRVTGRVTEHFDLTELSEVTAVLVCGSDSVAPTPVSLPVATLSALEAVEGMLVSFAQQLTASETYNLGRYGEVLLSAGGRLMQPTTLAEPGAPALALQAHNRLTSIQLDDGSATQNPLTPPYLAADGTLRIGDRTSGFIGAMGYAFGVYEMHPTTPVVFTRDNPRPAILEPAGGNLRVAGFNVLNYFTTLDTGAPSCGPTGGLDCRGANTATELARQRQKILAALSAIDADVLGINELENNASAAIADLVGGLNSLLGTNSYAYINTGTIGTDAIKVGLLYRPARVAPIGAHAILDSSVDPAFIDTLNRPVLAQTFRHTSSGEVFTVAVNHLKSKGSACPGDPDIGDLQGNCNLTRLAAVEAEAAWLASDPTNSADPDFLLIGDFNSYAEEDPIAALQANGYVNLVRTFLGANAYSYVFEGQSGYLDHAFASPHMASKIGRVTEWHINADEPRALDYNQEFNPPYLFQPNAYRSADHDPIIVDFRAVNAVPLPRWSMGIVAWLLLGMGASLVVCRKKS